MRFAVVLGLAAGLAASGCDYTTIYECAPETDGGPGDAGDDMSRDIPTIDGWLGKFGGMAQPQPRAVIAITDWASLTGSSAVDIRTIDGMPRPVAVTLVAPSFGDGPTVAAELFAIVQWGAGGIMARAFVDITRGGTLNLVAASVQVEIVQMMMGGAAFPPAAPRIPMCGAFAGPGPSSGHFRPTRTVGQNAPIVPAAVFGALIPPFARSVVVECSPPASALRLRLYSDVAGGVLSGQYNLVAFPSAEIPLPSDLGWNGGNYPLLTLENIGLANVDTVRLVFALDL